jgi:DNA-3-methyladenine glycosylase I
MSYCVFCSQNDPEEVNRYYHDNHYGFPIESDDELFGRLILEINQAGLSWQTILKKQQHFRDAYDAFSIEKVAQYGSDKIAELLQNEGIIRNKLKIHAAIHNAQTILTLQEAHGSFLAWLEKNSPLNREEWVKLFKKNFKFVGGEIVNEFLMSTGFLPGAHEESCSIYPKVIASNPTWTKK